MKYKLSDLFVLQMGKTPSRDNPEYWAHPDYPWISIADLSGAGKYIYKTKEALSELAIAESGIKIIPEQTVIMSFKLSIGKVCITPRPMYSNEAIMAFIDKGIIQIKPEYLYYLLLNKNWDEGTNKAVMGKTLNKATLSEVTIDVHPIEEQEKIIAILDKANEIIESYKRQILTFDILIKARYIEMFGDIEAGTCPYPTERLKNLSVKISDGVHAKPEYMETGKPFLSVMNINKGKVDFTECKYVSEEAYKKMIKSSNPQKGDVLYTKVGATYGIPAYVDTDREFCLYVSVCLIKPKHELINSRFLSLQMAMPSIKHQADERIKGIGVPDLHLNQISEFRIICPPMGLQDDYVAFVEQVEKTKTIVQKALDEAQLIFESLMQLYFG